MTQNRVIGKDNELPWRLPDEMAHFKRLTRSHAVVMGRKTFESMQCRPLPERLNIVLTRKDFDVPDVVFVDSLANGLTFANARGYEQCFVIGGSQVYEEALSIADCLYATLIDSEMEGDAFFPEFDLSPWQLESSNVHPADDRHAYAFTMNVYRRK